MSFMYLAVEDELSEAVGRKLIGEIIGDGISVHALRKGGFGYLKAKLRSFVEMSKHSPVLLLTDLDQAVCAPVLRKTWLGTMDAPQNLVFRVAVKEVEAWLLADSQNLSEYLGVQESAFPVRPDDDADPKASLLRIARRARRSLRFDLLPEKGALSSQGIGYNRILCEFVEQHWSLHQASLRSGSLERARRRIAELGERI